MKLIENTCPNCGAKLKTTDDCQKITCEFCNSEIIIENEQNPILVSKADDIGYNFEKGRQKAKKEAKQKRITPKTRLIVGCGVLTALATVLQYLEIPSPVFFIKLDFSDLPALIGAFAYGPIAGIIIQLLKNIIHLAVSQSGYVGELSNFLLGAVFCGVAGSIYMIKKDKKHAIIGGIVGALAMALISYPSNLYIVYPFYYNFMPKEAVLQVYQDLFKVKSVEMALLIYNVPFTFIKGLISVVVSAFIYKPLSPLLHGKNKK